MWKNIKSLYNDLPVIIQMAGYWFALFLIVGFACWIYRKMFPEPEQDESPNLSGK